MITAICILIALCILAVPCVCAIIYARSAAHREDEIDFTLEDWRNPFL